jgi:hypothetical protein
LAEENFAIICLMLPNNPPSRKGKSKMVRLPKWLTVADSQGRFTPSKGEQLTHRITTVQKTVQIFKIIPTPRDERTG